MKAEDLIKNNSLTNIEVTEGQTVVFTEIALTAMDMACEEGAKWQAEQSPWISVEERMPEDEQLVLTRSSIYGVKLLVWNGHYNVWDDEDGDDVYCERDKIDAWMPIPEV